MKSKLTGWSVVFTLLVPTFAFAFDQTSRHQEGLRENVPSVYALLNAKIVISPDTTLEHGTVIIANGKITAVGNEIEIPKHARVVDYSGHVIYPGFIDSMTTADVPLPSKDHGVYWNRQISPERKAAVELNPDDGKYRQAGFAARLIAPDSGILKGQSVLVLTGDQSVERRVLNANVFQHARLTVSRGGGRDRYPNSPMGAVALARQAMYDAQWYGAALKAFDAAPQLPKPEWNRSLEALQPVLELEQPLVVDTSNEILALRADRFAREFEISLILNGSGNEYRRLDAIAATGRPILLPVDFPSPPNVATREAAKTVTLEQLMNWDLAPENPARLHQAGVQFTLTTRGLDSPKDFWAQVRKAVERGLPESVALDALTRIPAKLCRVESQLGTLEKGKFANLVVFKESPFIHDAEAVDTWVAGERYEVNPAERQYAAGNWSFRLGREFQVHLEVEGDDDRLSAEAFVVATDADATEVENAERVKVSKIGMEGYRLSALLPGSLMDKAGVTRLTVILNPKNLDQAEGFVSDADGRDWRIVAKRSIASEMSEAQTAEAVEANETEDFATESEGESSHLASTSPANTKSSPRASYSVNFPLGAYGRGSVLLDEHPRVVFRDVTVWTCGEQGTIEKGDVLIIDGRIAAIGLDLDVPDDVVEVEGNGMHLTPGIIDCHSHMATDGGVNESGQAITAEVRIGDFIDCDDINIYRQLAGGVTTANILHGSANPIGGQNQVIKLRWGQLDEDMKFDLAPSGIKFALGENVKQANWGDEYTTRYPQTRMGVEQIMRDEFHAAKEYHAAWETWNQRREGLPPRRDLELEAVAEIVNGDRWIHCHSYRQDEILALIRTLDDFGIQIGSFQHILEGYKVADAMARHGAMGSAFSDWWAYKYEVVDAIPHAGALMHEAGVVVSFNSDDRELARHLNQEAAKAMKYGGVSAEEALKFVTLNPAKQLRIDQYVGSIEVGKHADIVLWSGSPLSNLSRCEQTWIDGVKYFDRQDDLANRTLVFDMRQALIQKILDSGEEMHAPGEGKVDPASLWPREDLFCHAHGHDGEEHGHEHK